MKNKVLTQQKADILSEILSSDQGVEIFSLEASEALKKINADFGHNFTIDEINEFASAVSVAVSQSQGELSDDSLGNVAGGLVITITAAGVTAVAKVLAGTGALLGGIGALRK